MMCSKSVWVKFVGSLFLTMALSPAFAQDKAGLEKDKKKVESEISYNQQLLNETSKDKKKSLDQVIILNNNIKKREQLIGTLNTERTRLDKEINKNTAAVDSLEKRLQQLRSDYAKMILVAQKTENIFTQLSFIFAADDFNQAYLRLRHLQQLKEARQQQAKQITETQFVIQERIDVLKQRKKEKDEVVQSVQDERNKLSSDKEKVNTEVKELEKKEKELKKTLEAKQKEARNLEKAIQKLIEEEIRKAEEARRAANADKTKESDFSLTPAEVALSNDFSSNRGRLPWPVERGIVSSEYGEHAHPVLKNVKVQNNGIDIITSSGTDALAIFSGTVSGVWKMPGFNNIVMIRHGEYITVYSKLETVSVKIGDKVSTRQKIGNIHTDAVSGSTELHFELWKGKTLQNPSSWLLPK
jgi:septal ring factor EnvC (AmiA/AmiB activator)